MLIDTFIAKYIEENNSWRWYCIRCLWTEQQIKTAFELDRNWKKRSESRRERKWENQKNTCNIQRYLLKNITITTELYHTLQQSVTSLLRCSLEHLFTYLPTNSYFDIFWCGSISSTNLTFLHNSYHMSKTMDPL